MLRPIRESFRKKILSCEDKFRQNRRARVTVFQLYPGGGGTITCRGRGEGSANIPAESLESRYGEYELIWRSAASDDLQSPSF